MTEHARELYDGPSLHQNEVYVCAADGQEWPCRAELLKALERIADYDTLPSPMNRAKWGNEPLSPGDIARAVLKATKVAS